MITQLRPCLVVLPLGVGMAYSTQAGNLADSVPGATLERRHCVCNDVVNLLNTMVGALVTVG